LLVGAEDVRVGRDTNEYWAGHHPARVATANPYIPSAPTSKAARTFNMDTVVFGVRT